MDLGAHTGKDWALRWSVNQWNIAFELGSWVLSEACFTWIRISGSDVSGGDPNGKEFAWIVDHVCGIKLNTASNAPCFDVLGACDLGLSATHWASDVQRSEDMPVLPTRDRRD
jgi:hypothetical protein